MNLKISTQKTYEMARTILTDFNEKTSIYKINNPFKRVQTDFMTIGTQWFLQMSCEKVLNIKNLNEILIGLCRMAWEI